MKVPQILVSQWYIMCLFVYLESIPVLTASSARGLSLPAYALETAGYAITTAYFYRNRYSFSTYGENFFLTVQNIFIVLLMIYYARPRLSSGIGNKFSQLILVSTLIGGSLYGLSSSPTSALQALQAATAPLGVLSKLPQIVQNYQASSTGQLSTFAVFAQVLGCLARIFTTSVEVNDSIAVVGFYSALALNLVLGAQVILYWGNRVEVEAGGVSNKFSYELPQQSKEAFSTAQTRHQSPPASRRWSRKVDWSIGLVRMECWVNFASYLLCVVFVCTHPVWMYACWRILKFKNWVLAQEFVTASVSLTSTSAARFSNMDTFSWSPSSWRSKSIAQVRKWSSNSIKQFLSLIRTLNILMKRVSTGS